MKVNTPKCLLGALLLISQFASAQGLIGTPTSLILVYNYPETYFYMEIKGSDKRTTEKPNVFIIDNRLIQVMSVKYDKFLSGKQKTSSIEIIREYINWELKYMEENLSLKVNNNLEFLKTAKGRDIAFWSYDMPAVGQETKTDATTTPTQKQLFVITRIKDYVVGINVPIFESDQYETTRNYLIANIDNIVESKKEIDMNELNKQINNPPKQ